MAGKLADVSIAEKAAEIKLVTADLLESSVSYGLNFLSAIILIIAGIFISGWVSRLIHHRLERVEKFDKTLVPFLAQIARYTILVMFTVLILAEFGIQTTSIIAVLGAAGLAIGLALQGTLQNVAAGIMLLIVRPFRVGDYIEAADTGGTVDAIGLFMTRLHTVQNVFIAVPNGSIWSGTITNYSMRPRRRLDLLIGISYDDDIDKAVRVLKGLLDEESRIFQKPEPIVIVKALGESSVDLEIRAWTKRQTYWELRFDMIRAVKYAFDEAGITIPYPHRQVIMQEAEKSGKAIEAA